MTIRKINFKFTNPQKIAEITFIIAKYCIFYLPCIPMSNYYEYTKRNKPKYTNAHQKCGAPTIATYATAIAACTTTT